ncbi:MAG: hypothetical protein LIP28_09615 [Deltaproteobacteria bacterium]|nr:hypothetical protein [Deltaproteobacteria bacterium]
MILIPLTADGARVVTVDTGNGLYRFRTYYSNGPERRWLLDIRDTSEKALATGIPIVPGSANLLKGLGDAFKDACLLAVAETDTDLGGMEAPGDTLHLAWMGSGEENLFPALDPMDTVQARYRP